MKRCIITSLVTVVVAAALIFTGCTNKNQDVSSNTIPNIQQDSVMNVSVSKPTEKSQPAVKKPLQGFTVCIDAGHGQVKTRHKKEPIAPGSRVMKDATASGTSGICTKISEESLNLTVSMKLKKALIDQGAKVIMIRETKQCDLTNVERAKQWNSSGAELTIRIHADGSDSPKASGAMMMVPGDKYIKDKEMLKKSSQAGSFILDGVIKYTKAKSRGSIKSNDLTGFNWSTIPVVLIEMGFMTNPNEDKLLNSDEYQNKIVTGIVEGVKNYHASLKK